MGAEAQSLEQVTDQRAGARLDLATRGFSIHKENLLQASTQVLHNRASSLQVGMAFPLHGAIGTQV